MGPFGRSSKEKTPKKKLLSHESEPSPEPLIRPMPQPHSLPQSQLQSQTKTQARQGHSSLQAQALDQAQTHVKEYAQAPGSSQPRSLSREQSHSRSQPRSQPRSRPQSKAQSHSHSQSRATSHNVKLTPPPSLTDSSDSAPPTKPFPGSFNMTRRVNQLTFTVVQKYQLDRYQWVIVARNKLDPTESLGIRLRVGLGGFSQWLNELYVYLLPKLRHENILPYAGSDKTSLPNRDRNQFSSTNLLDDTDELYESESLCSSDDLSFVEREDKLLQPTVDYWLLNDYGGCITLRHYLMMHTISWPQLIKIMHGIMSGLDFLHEYATYRYKRHRVLPIIENYIHSTHGLLKKVRFVSSVNREISMMPPLLLTIIHRNLTSLNIVLRQDFTPCIWNFGFANVYHPFQAMNYEHNVTRPIKNIIMSSPYSPPEVLRERGVFTLPSMKAIDMYASGIILWELMTRCVLPKLDSATPEENLERGDPDGYCEPFQFEFRCSNAHLNPFMLRHAVCRLRTRPFVKRCWLIGRKTNRMVQTMRELWDHDPEARISASTVIERLGKTSGRDHDKPYKYNVILERAFDLDNKEMWPAVTETTMAPLVPDEAFRNMVVEDLANLDDYEHTQLRELAESSDSDSVPLLGRCCFRIR